MIPAGAGDGGGGPAADDPEAARGLRGDRGPTIAQGCPLPPPSSLGGEGWGGMELG